MFPVPPGWTLASTAESVVLTSAHGDSIVVVEGLAPLAAVPVMIAKLEITDLTLDPVIERIVTCEGEYGAFVQGRAGAIAYAFGFVFSDDACVRIVGTSATEAGADRVAATVRETVSSTRLFLGTPRRRRFHYTAPPGWRVQQAPSGDETWFAANYPAHRASITVPRALPLVARAHVSMVSTLLGLAEARAHAPAATAITTGAGLVGHRWERTVTNEEAVAMAIVVIGLSDGRYDYMVRLIAPEAATADHEAFAELVESIVPLPGAEPATEASALSFWLA